MAAAMEERSIRIPLQEPAGEFVEVFASELPDEAEDLLFLLREERAPLPIWLQVATEYYRQRRLAQFEAILDVASSTEIEAMYPGPEHKLPKIQILNALAALRVQSGARETDKAKIGALQKDIVKLFERADRMDQMVEATWVTKGVNFLVSHSRLDDASQQFDNALDSSQTNLPAILGKACVHYHQGDFRKALARFSAAITLHPHASNGASVRVGLGICWLKLGNSALAHAAFDRALAIDPTNVDALVAKGVLQQWPVKGEAPEGEKARIEAAMLNITRAYQADTANPTALNHLANHYYWKWSKVDGGTLAATQGSAVLEIEAAAGGSGAGGGVGATLQELMGGKQCQLRLVGAGAGGSAGFTRTVVLVGAAPPSAGAGPGAVMMSEPWAMPSCGGLTAQRRDAKRVIKLANQAKENTKSQRVVAESWYMLGRVAQASGEHDSAFLYFSRALKCWPEFTLASFGVGQACVAVGGEPKEATKHFEKVLRAFPDSVETLCVLASLKTQIAAGSGSGGAAARREALELLTRAVEIRPSDPSIWLDKATLCQSRALVDKNEALEALEAYARAHVLLEARQERVPVELLVNKGVLQMQLEADAAAGGGHSAASVAAELSFMTALELNCGGDRKKAEAQALGGTKECPIEAQNVTICYNLARLHERACSAEKTETAAAIYNGIMDAFEGYHDAYLRLGCIYRDAGNFEKAEQIFTEAAKNALPKSDAAFDAHSLLAKLHMAKPVPKQNLAQKAIECVLKQSKNDPYTKVLYGNMFFDSLDVPDRYEKNMAHSHKYFSDVLQAEPTNIFAANGMGMVLAEKGFLNEAKQVFTHLREASAGLEVPDIWMNLAHVLLAQGRHLEAVSMYENCLTKFAVGVGGSGGKAAHFDNKDRGKLMLYLAHAHYLAAEERRKQDKIDSIEHYTSCILLLRKALRLAPQDLPLRFNLAYTQGQSAVVRLSLLRNGKTNLVRAKDRLEEVQRAVAQVECASSVFRWLEGQSSFENAKAKKAAATCAVRSEATFHTSARACLRALPPAARSALR